MGFGLFAVIFFLVLVGFLMFDVVLRRQYHNFREDWEKAGKPDGFFWNPQESRWWWTGSIQRSVRILSWTFFTEDWIKSDAPSHRAVIAMRICIFLAWALMVAFGITGVSR